MYLSKGDPLRMLFNRLAKANNASNKTDRLTPQDRYALRRILNCVVVSS